MEKVFCLGLVVGAAVGALVVANNYKARSLVKKSQAEFLQKVDEMMEERLSTQNRSEEGGAEKSAKK